jgi:endoglucanase
MKTTLPISISNGEKFTRCIAIMAAFVIIIQMEASPEIVTEFIKIDQFGYRNNDQKIAVISDPIIGYNADLSFAPGEIYQVKEWFTDEIVFIGSPISWHNGEVHDQSGDKIWHLDFSSVVASGSYYIYDVSNNVGSYRFDIDDCTYNEILKIACRANYYQRCGIAKTLPFAYPSWTDAACHIGAHQDLDCRPWNDPTNDALSRDLSGGWHDAGDYNKYVNYVWNPVLDMLLAYEEYPTLWTDDYNLPESGNGIPDLLDEVKYELDWLLKMQNPDGGVLCVVGTNNYESASPPSADATNNHSRFYGPATTQATYSAAAMFALASIEFNAIGQAAYASQLSEAAMNAWNWAEANPGIIFHNNNQNIDNGPINYLAAGDQEGSWTGFVDQKKAVAACYLFSLTNDANYRQVVDANYTISNMDFHGAESNGGTINDALLYYSKSPNATLAVQNEIINLFSNSLQNGINNLPSFLNSTDAYRAYIMNYNWDIGQFESVYDWGSNYVVGHQGIMYLNMLQYDLDASNAAQYWNAASGYLHYFHGVNPNSKTFLSNMKTYGAENSIQSFYHSWFNDGTVFDFVSDSTVGPAPGFTVMGADEKYETYTCCATNCESNCSEVEHLMNDPAQKCYKDFNTSYPFASWTITENQISAQASYIRLLSKFCTAECTPLHISNENNLSSRCYIYPNPTTSTISIHTGKSEIETIQILNTLGEIVSETKTAINHSIDVSALPNGVYTIRTSKTIPPLLFIKQ